MEAAIRELFENEFGTITEKFFIQDVAVCNASASAAEFVAHPGVYVFWRPGRVIKVGRHLTNARKRAMEHISCNTGGSMGELIRNPDARLTLISLKNPQDRHWAAAVEIFLEVKLSPEVRAARLG